VGGVALLVRVMCRYFLVLVWGGVLLDVENNSHCPLKHHFSEGTIYLINYTCEVKHSWCGFSISYCEICMVSLFFQTAAVRY
jgi:hypothetical protein